MIEFGDVNRLVPYLDPLSMCSLFSLRAIRDDFTVSRNRQRLLDKDRDRLVEIDGNHKTKRTAKMYARASAFRADDVLFMGSKVVHHCES